MKKLLLCLLMVPAMARAEFFTGNNLLALLKSNNSMDLVQGLGYVQGVFDSHVKVTICPPPNITAGQVSDMVRNYLDNNPATRNYSADSLISNALRQVWPCANRTPGRGA